MDKRLVAIAAAAVAVALSPVAAWADGGPPTTALGTFTVTSLTVTSARTADGNTIEDVTVGGNSYGTFTGPWVETDRWIVSADGSITAHGFGQQTLLAGPCVAATGFFNYQADFRGSFATGFSGFYRSVDEAANPVSIHTVISFAGPVDAGPPLTLGYSGTYTCT